MNRWLIDRGDGRPSVNLVVLSFVHPLKLLNGTTDSTTLNGVPRGMTADIVALLHVARRPGHGLDRRDHLREGLERRALPGRDAAGPERGGGSGGPRSPPGSRGGFPGSAVTYGAYENELTATSTGWPLVGAAPLKSHRFRWTRSSPGSGTSVPE